MMAVRKWLGLLAGIGGIAALLAGLSWLSGQTGPTRQLRDSVEQQNMDNTSLFYTESEMADRAVYRLKQRMQEQ